MESLASWGGGLFPLTERPGPGSVRPPHTGLPGFFLVGFMLPDLGSTSVTITGFA